MDPEERRMLERLLALTEQNNRILRGMRRSAFFGRLMHIMYWIIIIGISVAAYYYIQPYIENVRSALEAVDQIKDFKLQ